MYDIVTYELDGPNNRVAALITESPTTILRFHCSTCLYVYKGSMSIISDFVSPLFQVRAPWNEGNFTPQLYNKFTGVPP